MSFFGSIISGIGSLAGGLIGRSGAQDAAEAQDKFQRNFVQIRAKDARKAGIHPLAALGASAPAYTPVNTASALADGVAAAAGDIGRAVGKSGKERLQFRAVESEIKVNEQQAALLAAQRLSVEQGIRNQAQGAVPAKNPLPSPSNKEAPLHINVRGADGRTTKMLNPDIAMDISEVVGTYLQNAFGGVVQDYYNHPRRKKSDFQRKRKKIPEITIYRNHSRGY